MLGAQEGPGAENKCSEAFVTVGGALICSRQVTAQQDKCRILQSVALAFAVSRHHLINHFFLPQVNGAEQNVPGLKKNKIMKKEFNWRNHFFTLQQRVFGLFGTCPSHYMIFIGFLLFCFRFVFLFFSPVTLLQLQPFQ